MKLLFVFASLICLGQAKDDDGAVTVPRKYVSAEGLSHAINNPSVSQWVGVGKEIGIATREGLESVVDVSNKFGATNVGRFVMFMVAWHIIGHQLMTLILGIPIWIAGIILWIYSMKRFFWGRLVLKKVNADKSKEYSNVIYQFDGGDARVAAGVFHAVFLAVWCIAWIAVIF